MPKSRRFEYTDATSRKFWEVSVAAATVTVQYGRIGTDGQTQVKAYDSPAVATATAEKQIAEKVKKGYHEIGAGETAQQSAPAKTPAKKAPAKKAPAKKAPAKKAPAKKAATSDAEPMDDIDKILQSLNTPAVKEKEAGGMAGKTFLFTGTLATMTRAEAEQRVKTQGGTVLSTVSDRLDYLVAGEKAGSKLAQAQKILTVSILTETDFRTLAGEVAAALGSVTPLRKQDLMQSLLDAVRDQLYDASFELEMDADEAQHIEEDTGGITVLRKLSGGRVRVRVEAERYIDNNFRDDFVDKINTDDLPGSEEYDREELEQWISERVRALVDLFNGFSVLGGEELHPEEGDNPWENPRTIYVSLDMPTCQLVDLNPAWTGARFAVDNAPFSAFCDEIS